MNQLKTRENKKNKLGGPARPARGLSNWRVRLGGLQWVGTVKLQTQPAIFWRASGSARQTKPVLTSLVARLLQLNELEELKHFSYESVELYKAKTKANLGIIHSVICPHTRHQDGVVERKCRHIVEIGLILYLKSLFLITTRTMPSTLLLSSLIDSLPPTLVLSISKSYKIKTMTSPSSRFLGVPATPFLGPSTTTNFNSGLRSAHS